MSDIRTEALGDGALGLDQRPLAEAAALLAAAQVAAARVVGEAALELAAAASDLALTLRAGGRIHYVAAGSSGLMAAADALELGGTFSIPADQLSIHMAGGLPTGVEMPGQTEDETETIAEALSHLSGRDAVIAVSASGTTPWTLAAARVAKARGVCLIAIANNPGAPLLADADHPICLPTPPELLAGSTRMGAGTAQKVALNVLSTLMAIALGHVHDGMMVNLRVENAKLAARAAGIVARIAGVDLRAARAALEAAGGAVKPAVLVARAGLSAERAEHLLAETHGNLRAALARLA